MKAKQVKYHCTQCGRGAYLGYSNFRSTDGEVLIKKNERLCTSCKDARLKAKR
jgi:hypothetical protein